MGAKSILQNIAKRFKNRGGDRTTGKRRRNTRLMILHHSGQPLVLEDGRNVGALRDVGLEHRGDEGLELRSDRDLGGEGELAGEDLVLEARLVVIVKGELAGDEGKEGDAGAPDIREAADFDSPAEDLGGAVEEGAAAGPLLR